MDSPHQIHTGSSHTYMINSDFPTTSLPPVDLDYQISGFLHPKCSSHLEYLSYTPSYDSSISPLSHLSSYPSSAIHSLDVTWKPTVTWNCASSETGWECRWPRLFDHWFPKSFSAFSRFLSLFDCSLIWLH